MPRNNKTLYEKTLVKAFDIKTASKALAYLVFREVIEDVHAEYNISQDEMKAMNKRAVNRAAMFLESLQHEERLHHWYRCFRLEPRSGIIQRKQRTRRDFYNLPRNGPRSFVKLRINQQQRYTDDTHFQTVLELAVEKHRNSD